MTLFSSAIGRCGALDSPGESVKRDPPYRSNGGACSRRLGRAAFCFSPPFRQIERRT